MQIFLQKSSSGRKRGRCGQKQGKGQSQVYRLKWGQNYSVAKRQKAKTIECCLTDIDVAFRAMLHT